MSNVYRTYRKNLVQIYIFICSLILVVSMMASLFRWVDVTVLLDYTWSILMLCFILNVVSAMTKVTLGYIQLLSKDTFISIIKNTLYAYCVIVGSLCPLIIYGVSLDAGIRIIFFLQVILLVLYIIAFLLDRIVKIRGSVQ